MSAFESDEDFSDDHSSDHYVNGILLSLNSCRYQAIWTIRAEDECDGRSDQQKLQSIQNGKPIRQCQYQSQP